MTDLYYENRITDYTLRIANLDTIRQQETARGNLIKAKACEKEIDRLEQAKAEYERRRTEGN